jgi:REP element-mobilizing transposase RayT
VAGDTGDFQVFKNRLPQWRLAGYAYSVTWRLHPSQAKLAEAERGIVAEALKYHHGQRYRLYAYVVMDDHVHALVQPLSEYKLSTILHTWKSFTAHRLQRESARQGGIWQKDTHTRIVRGEEELHATARYVLDNPRRRWPGLADYPWAEYI